MAATLRLTRKAAGIELWRGRFDVTVDGSSVGTLERQDTIETPIAPGPHTLVLRMGWPQLIASLIAPDLAIFIRPEED